MRAARPVLRTRLSDFLGIEYPIIQSGMGGVAGMWAGQSVGLIHNLPGAAEVVEAVGREARQLLLERLPQTVRLA